MTNWIFSLWKKKRLKNQPALSRMTQEERELIRQAMKFIAESDSIEDPEFQTRMGIERGELRTVLNRWPEIDDHDDHSTELKGLPAVGRRYIDGLM